MVRLPLFLCFPAVAVAKESDAVAHPKPRFDVPVGHTVVREEINGPKYKRLACSKDGVLNGPCEEYTFTASKNTLGLVQHGLYVAGKKQGPWVTNPSDHAYARVRREDYEKGELVYFRSFGAKDGMPIFDTPMRKGQAHGVQRSFVDDGRLSKMHFHQNGIPVGPTIGFRPDRQVSSLTWTSHGVMESVGAMVSLIHQNGKLRIVGWQLDPGGHALSKFWAGPRLGFRADGTLYIEELRSHLGVLLYRKAYYPDGTRKAMIERREREDEATAHPVWTREVFAENVANRTVAFHVRAALKVDTYTLRLWDPNGELKKSEDVSGVTDIYDAEEQVN